jgi:hypothetical protein
MAGTRLGLNISRQSPEPKDKKGKKSKMKTIQQLANDVLEIQDASNLSGVVHAFHRAISDIWDNARILGHGTDWVNRHPICRAYASKIQSLSRLVTEDSTFEECEAISAGLSDKR